MKRLIPLALLLCTTPLLAQPAPPPEGEGGPGRPQRAYANPSALIAADIAFARLAREKGQWTAFRETAADTAEMFDGNRVPAKALLKDRKDPAEPYKWAPRAAWIACDGSAGLTIGGASYPEGGNGEYVTVWERQFKGKQAWKWVLDDGVALAKALPELDWAQGTVADCPVRRRPEGDVRPQPGSKRERKEQGKNAPVLPLAGPLPANNAPEGSDSKTGQSRDGSLAWRSTVLPDGSRHHTAWIWKNSTMTQVFDRVFPGKGA
ncbi:MAG: hypothetical protein B7X90_15615 [Novosphingobium sp. 17-62-19]|uniref:hypothetical protein n=1 Tax=Novosphingobium sp. 17-62-19 TaxID=1970406 RepID=UPI000BC532B8|nr:hypothetical protein [Novosphingobium sp. 17-62-19]OZA17261.1 MAG: hypothetical protein B7X90_15615 [Novosphingobium sp. 17-62-19]OZA72598.1 MAG: hypothetical protein B7X78_00745 [Sphingomonadales bacterium 39-62-4]HQS96496.1 hypothetical protein [Novosphingobium sp.]